MYFPSRYLIFLSTADIPLAQLIQALSIQQPGACKLPCMEVAMFECSLSL